MTVFEAMTAEIRALLEKRGKPSAQPRRRARKRRGPTVEEQVRDDFDDVQRMARWGR